ncbi:MAG: hypothetical protein MZV63_40945 [Marinilabiliales bacterium]|nr:hypothetical protein [Marinilabiliales bacterium]
MSRKPPDLTVIFIPAAATSAVRVTLRSGNITTLSSPPGTSLPICRVPLGSVVQVVGDCQLPVR